MPGLVKGSASMSSQIYDKISSYFKDEFGEDCGWAHSLLFAAELTMFKALTVPQKTKRVKEEGKEELQPATRIQTVQASTTRRRSPRFTKVTVKNEVKEEEEPEAM